MLNKLIARVVLSSFSGGEPSVLRFSVAISRFRDFSQRTDLFLGTTNCNGLMFSRSMLPWTCDLLSWYMEVTMLTPYMGGIQLFKVKNTDRFLERISDKVSDHSR
eukprot:GFUD01119752.1.p1 GENE.GFUD01119752.1~~GFUD01119752.1.p1  ORF type:complete len:105 (+),score=13.52 GFUD01119752.1:259-573(+)